MNPLELTGRTRSHIKQHENPRFAAQTETVAAFFDMKTAAAREGIKLHPFSAFRDFNTQLKIWNKKYQGERPLYSQSGKLIDYASLSKPELIHYILSWSALPGASRHHWGTDIDVIDLATIDEHYQVELLPEESEKGGVFYHLHCWLDENMHRFGFFRPYQKYNGGINPEPWHLSYAPISNRALDLLTIEILEETIKTEDIHGKEYVLENLPTIYRTYIVNICKGDGFL
ncbi:M15 family metallopeptidase [bacterium]|nr:M15 family metallopeptidase [bacterium]